MALLLGFAMADGQGNDSTFADISLDSLLNIRISSVSKYEQASREAPANVTILAADDIAAYGHVDLMEALQTIQSIYLSYDRNYTYIGMRGFSRPTDYNNRILFLIDGVPMNDNIWGGVACRQDYFAISMDQVERIEVIRGASSALYGTSAMMGVINVVMKDGQALDGGNLKLQAGSYGRKSLSAAFGKRSPGGLDCSVGVIGGMTNGQRLYYPEFDSDTTLHGIADHLNATRFAGAYAKLKYKGLQVKLHYSGNHTGIPTAAYETIFGSDGFTCSDRQGFAELSYTRDIGSKQQMSLRSSLNDVYYHQEYPYAPSHGGTQVLMTQGTWISNELRYRWDMFSTNRITAGAVYQYHFRTHFFSRNATGILTDATFPYYTASAFLQDEFQPTKWLTLTAGGRFDRNYLGKQAITPRLCAAFYPNEGSTIKMIYGRAFRSPTISELSAADGFSDQGNPNLKAEFVTNGEVTWEQRIGKRWFTTASVFMYRVSGLVGRVHLNDSIDSFGNISAANCGGAELGLIARLWPGKRFYASLSYQELSSVTFGGWMTNSPRWIFKGGGTVNFLQYFRWAGEIAIETRRETVQDTYTPMMVLWNMNLAYHPGKDDATGFMRVLHHTTWSIRCYNLLNWKNFVPGGYEHIQPAIQQNGRNFVLNLNWAF